MFFVFITAFTLYAIFIIPQGHYDDFICQRYEREIFLDTITLILDFTVIIAVLNLHRTTYKDNTGVPQNQIPRKSQKVRDNNHRNSEKKPLPIVIIEEVDRGSRVMSEPFLDQDSFPNEPQNDFAKTPTSLSHSTIEYSAEMLDNQELYDRMHNRMQGGEYKGILMRLSLPR